MGLIGGDIATNNVNSSVVLAKIKDSNSNTVDGSGIMANTTTSNSQMATNNSTAANEEVSNVDLCAASTPDRNNLTSTNNETLRYFDIDYASDTFDLSMADKNAISLHHYLNGFKELMK